MDKAEAKRRARVAAWHILDSALQDGADLYLYTDNGSDRQTAMVARGLREVMTEINNRLPEGYEVPGFLERSEAAIQGEDPLLEVSSGQG